MPPTKIKNQSPLSTPPKDPHSWQTWSFTTRIRTPCQIGQNFNQSHYFNHRQTHRYSKLLHPTYQKLLETGCMLNQKGLKHLPLRAIRDIPSPWRKITVSQELCDCHQPTIILTFSSGSTVASTNSSDQYQTLKCTKTTQTESIQLLKSCNRQESCNSYHNWCQAVVRYIILFKVAAMTRRKG